VSDSLAQGRQFGAIPQHDRLGKTLIPGHTQLRNRTSFGIRSWTGNESISRNPSGVPILDGCTAHGAFKAADLARLYDMFAAVRCGHKPRRIYRTCDLTLTWPQHAPRTVRFPVNNPAKLQMTLFSIVAVWQRHVAG
jgi:hypothetical protein